MKGIANIKGYRASSRSIKILLIMSKILLDVVVLVLHLIV